ncbi:MAG: hypothetical protein QXX68_01060 [Candidatus Pacearchaeota archaeon]
MRGENRSFVITAAQAYQNPNSARLYGRNEMAGRPNEDLISSLERYCQSNSADLIIQAIRGSYAGEIELDEFFMGRKDVFMESSALRRLNQERLFERKRREEMEKFLEEHPLSDKEIPMHYFWREISDFQYNTLDVLYLNKKIALIEPQTPPQNEDPAKGNRDIVQDYIGTSIIMPHSKQRLVSVPKDLAGKLPRLFLTTGCCTYPNYNETNARGKRAARHHQYGFVVVDILGEKKYLPRLVPALEDGSFIDLGVLYSPRGEPREIGAEALVLGDIHVPFQDFLSIKASIEMIKSLKPKSVFLHDVFDFYCINHHSAEDSLWKMLIAEKGLDSLEYELELALEFLNEISDSCPKTKFYIVPSNHDEFVRKWISSGRILRDPRNMRIGGGIIKNYSSEKSIVQIALEQVGKIPKNIEFLLLDSDQRPHDFVCSAHGHLGIEGSKGSLKQFKVTYGKVVTGHTHTLEVDGHAISAGTNSRIPLEYQRGQPSKAMHGNVAIYKNGLAQAIPIVEGVWRK